MIHNFVQIMDRFLFHFFAALLFVGIYGRKLTYSEQKSILDYHNHVRRQVANGEMVDGSGRRQPPARNMVKLVSLIQLYRLKAVLS